MLGQDLVRTTPYGIELVALSSKEFDVTKPELVENRMKQISPDKVIHCAAWTDVDGCEKDPEKAEQANVLGTRNVGRFCSDFGIPFCYISTDFVFDGLKNVPYIEDDLPNPINVYGKTKLAGEEWVRGNLTNWFIVRTSWLFGVSGKNFVTTMLRFSKEQSFVKVVNDQVGSPTFTEDLASAIWQLALGEKFGLYHITNSGNCSWYQFACEIFKAAKIDKEVIPITSNELSRPATRPHYSVLSNGKWTQNGFAPLRHYNESLLSYLSLIKTYNAN